MVLTGDGADVNLALESGAMAVVCEDDFLSPEMEVLQSILAVANGNKYISNLAKSRMQKPGAIFESSQSLTPWRKKSLPSYSRGFPTWILAFNCSSPSIR